MLDLIAEEPQIQKAELRLKDIAELIGDDWRLVASRLGITPEEVEEMVGSDGAIPNAEALAMLQQWVQKNGSEANGNSLERALRDLGRDDIIASCMCNVADVTDSKEKAAARSYLDSGRAREPHWGFHCNKSKWFTNGLQMVYANGFISTLGWFSCCCDRICAVAQRSMESGV